MRVLLNDIMNAHSSITLRLYASDSRADFYRDGIDVALRAMKKGVAQELNLYGFKICNIPHVVCASPSYLKLNGEPCVPSDLSEHNALLYKLYEVVHADWEFYDNTQQYKVKMNSDRAVNDGDIVRRWCIDGAGIAKKSAIDVADDLLSGKLKRIIPNYKVPLTEMWLVLPSRQFISPAIRLIRDELKSKIMALRASLLAKHILSEDEWPCDD